MTAARWAGVDVGGGRKGFHLVLVDDHGIVAGPERRAAVSEAVAWLRAVGPALTAVDAPAALAPDGERSRPCERQFLAAGICGLRPTPSRTVIEARGDGYYGWIENGLALHRALEHTGLAAIECFPTASWTRWGGPRGTRTRARWTRAGMAALALEGLPARTSQDDRDAIAAAVTARAHCHGETEAFGEIVVPLAPPEAVG